MSRSSGGEPLAPDGGVERVAELTLEGQGHAGGRLFAPEPPPPNPVLGRGWVDDHVPQGATPHQPALLLAQDREVAERELLVARERVPQPCGCLFGRARPAA